MMGVSVAVQGLTRTFTKAGHQIPVLAGAELTIDPGGAVALLGQSGSGKSTFLHLLGALEPPTAGKVFVDGVDVHGLSGAALNRYRNRTVAFIFQFHHLLPDHDAMSNVAMPALIAGVSKAEALKRAAAGLERVGLGSRLRHRPGELSGGEQQRVAIARALMMSPGLILADEPTGNLDPRTAAEVMQLLLGIQSEHRATLVVVTHSTELAGWLPRRIRLKDGRFVEEP